MTCFCRLLPVSQNLPCLWETFPPVSHTSAEQHQLGRTTEFMETRSGAWSSIWPASTWQLRSWIPSPVLFSSRQSCAMYTPAEWPRSSLWRWKQILSWHLTGDLDHISSLTSETIWQMNHTPTRNKHDTWALISSQTARRSTSLIRLQREELTELVWTHVEDLSLRKYCWCMIWHYPASNY